MTHTKHRKRRARFIFQVERIYPALIEGRMARGHRAVGALLPWRPKLHGWRDGGYVTDDDKLIDFRIPDDHPVWAQLMQRAEIEWPRQNGKTHLRLPDDRPEWAVFIAPLGTPPPGRSGVR